MKLLALAAFLLLVLGLSAQKVTMLKTFDIDPNPMEQECRIVLSVHQPMQISVAIEDAKGMVIKNLHWGYVERDLCFVWDRYDNNGQYVASGTYYVVVGTSDRYTSTKKTLILK